MKFHCQLISSVYLAVATASAFELGKAGTASEKTRFLSFVAKQGKSYPTLEEFNSRMKNWKKTDNFINNYPKSSFTMSHNKFSDWSEEEK